MTFDLSDLVLATSNLEKVNEYREILNYKILHMTMQLPEPEIEIGLFSLMAKGEYPRVTEKVVSEKSKAVD